MKTAEERHMEVMVRLSKIDTKIEERIIPAVDQAWENKDEILIIKTNKENAKDHRGRVVAYASLMISFVMVTLLGIKHFKG